MGWDGRDGMGEMGWDGRDVMICDEMRWFEIG